MKIEKLKSGSYRIRKMYKGVTYSVVTDYKPTQREAIKLLDQEMDKATVKKVRMTFETAYNEYINIKSNILSPSTIRGYKTIINNLSMEFKKKIVTDITSLDVQKEINRYSKNRSSKTIRNAHGLIATVLNMFCPNLILNTSLPQKEKKFVYIPTDEDVSKIMKASEGTKFQIPLILAAYGLRRSEICALTIDDIQGNTLIINKAKVQDSEKNWIIKKTKSTEGTRKIYLPPQIIEIIKNSGSIYSGHPNSIVCWLYKKQKELNIPRFSLHKLRHYYASVSHSLGIPDVYIMQAGGWKSDDVLKSVYRHALEEKNKEMQEFSAEYIEDIICHEICHGK